MQKRKLFFVILLLLLVLNTHIVTYAEVIDTVSELTDEQSKDINELLSKYEQETGIEVTLYFFDSIGKREIDKVAYGLYSLNYDTETNLLILYYSLDEQLYIEPGLDIQSKFDSNLCQELKESLGINFKNQDYVEGVTSILNMSKEVISETDVVQTIPETINWSMVREYTFFFILVIMLIIIISFIICTFI